MPSSTSRRPLVLVIEDDGRLAPALAILLEDWGYDCLTVSSAAEAAAALTARDRLASAVVCDEGPVEDGAGAGGRSAAAIARAVGESVPVIATAANFAEACRLGFTQVLAKPYEPDELRRWLAERLRLS